MSATNRGTKRVKQDAYMTPRSAFESLINNWKFPRTGNLTFLEPCCGTGNILKWMLEITTYDTYIVVETRDEELLGLREIIRGRENVELNMVDFFLLYYNIYKEIIDIIITNPPYTLDKVDIARKFIEAGLYCLKPGGQMAFLLRLNYLGSQKRKEFNNSLPLKHLFILSKRPSFTGKGSDATEYCWFIYEKGYDGLVEVKCI